MIFRDLYWHQKIGEYIGQGKDLAESDLGDDYSIGRGHSLRAEE